MNWEKLLLKSTEYGGDREPGSKSISASQLTAEPLQRWLRYKYGVIPADTISMATIGSLVHMAIEDILEGVDGVESEKDMSVPLENDWLLTGTADIIDHASKEILDIKVVKKYRLTKIKEQGTKDPYVIQLNTYRYLLKQEIGKDYGMKILALSPDAGFDFKKGILVPTFQIINIPYIPDNEIEQMALDKTNEIQAYIDSDTTPEKCKDTWPRKVGGKTISVRCNTYCSYSKVCPHYNPKPESVIAGWGLV